MDITKKNKNIKTRWVQLLINFITPVALTVALFIISTYYIALPNLKQNIMEAKKELLSETTEMIWEILVFYNERVQRGELSLEDAQITVKLVIRNIRYGSDKKDYFWISDLNAFMIMHPYRKDLEGKDLSDFQDSKGKKLVAEFVKVTETTGEGYTDYVWQWKDDSNKTGDKLSFVKRFVPWGWIIGTGVYLDDMDQKITQINSEIKKTFLVILLIVTLLCIYIIIRSSKTEKERLLAQFELLKNSKELKKLALVASKTDNAVIITDPQGKIEWINDSFTRITGFSQKEVVGKKPSELLNGEKTDKGTLLKMKNSLEKLESVNVELCNYTKAKNLIWLNIEVQPVLDEEGSVINYIAIEQDITDRIISEKEKVMAQRKINESASLINKQNEDLKNAYKILKNEVREREKAEIELTLNREKLRALTSELALAEERERRKIAIDLHDGICQTLAMVKMKLEMLKGQCKTTPKEVLSDILINVEELINDTRSMAIDLSPPALYELGLESALEGLIDKFSVAHDMEFTFICNHDLGGLSKDVEVLVFHSIKELLTNAIKHSMASRVEVKISFERGVLKVFVQDNGIGMKDVKLKTTRLGGFGLFSIKERLSHMGGSLRYNSNEEKGVLFSMHLPVKI